MNLYDFSNKPEDRRISTRWFFDELQKLRPGEAKISDRTKRHWKNLASVPNDGRTKLHKLTPQECARITFLALWDSEIKKTIESRLKAKDFEQNSALIVKPFKQWFEVAHFGSAANLLDVVRKCHMPNGKELKAMAERTAKKEIPDSTFRGWLKSIGQTYRVSQVYCPEVAISILGIAKAKSS